MCVVEGNSNDFARPGYYYQCDSLSSKVEESHNWAISSLYQFIFDTKLDILKYQ